MIDIVKIYNEIISEFNKFNIKLDSEYFSVNDMTIFPVSEVDGDDEYIEYANQYYYIKSKIEKGKNVSKLISQFENTYDITFDELESAINNILYKIIDKNTILYNLVTDTYEPMQFKDTYSVNLVNFSKEISSIKNKNVNIIVNHITLFRYGLDEYGDNEVYTFINVFDETKFLKNNIDYTELLKNFHMLIKDTFNLNNIYVYDYTKDDKICKLYMDLFFIFNNNVDINYLNTVINNILAKNILNKEQYNFKLQKRNNNELLLEITFNLTFNDYVALTKMMILYNIIDSL